MQRRNIVSNKVYSNELNITQDLHKESEMKPKNTPYTYSHTQNN